MVETTPDEPVKTPEPTTAQRAVSGGVWTMIGYGGGQVVRLGSSLVMTRLLCEGDFGLMAVTWSVIQGLSLFSDLGIVTSLVQNRSGSQREFRDTAFTLQLLRGLLIFLVAVVVSPLVEQFYPDYVGLSNLLIAAGFCNFIAGFEATSLAMLSRNMAFASLSLLNLGIQLLTSATMIVWAWIDPTPWALVGGTLVGAVVRAATGHLLFGRDRLGWDRAALAELFTFGKWVFVSTALLFLVAQADRLMFAKMIPPALLGVYSVGRQVAMVVPEISGRLTGGVLFPAYCRTLQEGLPIDRNFIKYRRPILVFSGFGMASAVGAGTAGVDFIYPEGFAEAGWILQYLVAGAWFGYALQGTYGSALLAVGQPRLVSRTSVAKLVGMVVLIPIGFWLAGFPGAVAAYAATDLVRYVTMAVAARSIGVHALADDARLTLWFAATATAAWLAQHLLEGAGWSPLARCAAALMITTVLWIKPLIPLVRDIRARLPL